MNKLILLATVICFAFAAQIQTAAAGGNTASLNPLQVKQQVEQLAGQLSLIGTQKEQFMEIFKQQYIKFQLPPSSISDEAMSSLKSLLTEEQFIQFDALIRNP